MSADQSTLESSGASATGSNAPRKPSSRRRRFLIAALTYSGIIAVTLLVLDLVCMALGLFPPRLNPGDPDLGWRPAAATGALALGRCGDVVTGETIDYVRNEDGVRTRLGRSQLQSDSITVKIAVTGDSHTDLCSTNEQLHSGVLEAELQAQGVPAAALPYGAGKYSPLQAYLAYRKILAPYHPGVFVMNLYTGNDFYDILRIDDRPHFVATDSGYQIAPPVWYSLDDPAARHRSRVLFAARSIAEGVGVRRLYLRVSELRRVAAEQNAGIPAVARYIRDLYKAREHSVGYPDAFTSQMLNQQLFFHHFPQSKEESIRRVAALMARVRAENPGLMLIMSPIPSYQLVGEQPVDSALTRTLQRVPITYEAGVRQENELYQTLRGLAAEQGWLFVDNLAALQGYKGSERLYNNFDYHLQPTASALIGQAQARVILEQKRKTGGNTSS